MGAKGGKLILGVDGWAGGSKDGWITYIHIYAYISIYINMYLQIHPDGAGHRLEQDIARVDDAQGL